MMARSGTTMSVSSRWRVGASKRGGPPVFVLRQPNMRLKLSGLLLRESAVASPGPDPRGGPVPCAGTHAARSLSAIR